MRADHASIFPLPNSFVDMLPALLWHEIGGGSSVNQAIAAWMRHNGVAGMIFPSARMNCGVICRNGKVTDFRGWNFVDYRDVGPPANDGFVDVGSWPDSLGEGVLIRYATNAEYEGSWYLEGYEELQARERDQLLVRSQGSVVLGARLACAKCPTNSATAEKKHLTTDRRRGKKPARGRGASLRGARPADAASTAQTGLTVASHAGAQHDACNRGKRDGQWTRSGPPDPFKKGALNRYDGLSEPNRE